VFQHAHALVGEVKADHGAAQGFSRPYHMQVHDVRHAHQHEDQHLFEDTPKPHGAGQLPVDHRAHDPGHVVHHHQDEQRGHQPVHATHEVPQPAAHGGNGHLQLGPYQINRKVTHDVSSL